MEMKTFLLVVDLWFSLSVSNFHFEASGDVIPSPTCEACQQPSPPLFGYPSYVAPPPPPPPSPTPSGYSVYGAPPPPDKQGRRKCPPASGVQCCTPPAPYTYGYGGYGPPNPYAPPYPYTYVPYGAGEGPASMLLPILVPLMMLFSSFSFLF